MLTPLPEWIKSRTIEYDFVVDPEWQVVFELGRILFLHLIWQTCAVQDDVIRFSGHFSIKRRWWNACLCHWMVCNDTDLRTDRWVLYFSLWVGAALCVLPAVRADAEDSSLLWGWQDVWIFRLFLNVLGYATIIIPGYFLISYFKRVNYLETGLLKKHSSFNCHVLKCAYFMCWNCHLNVSCLYRSRSLFSCYKDVRVWEWV